jgi:hypothetical protein
MDACHNPQKFRVLWHTSLPSKDFVVFFMQNPFLHDDSGGRARTRSQFS